MGCIEVQNGGPLWSLLTGPRVAAQCLSSVYLSHPQGERTHPGNVWQSTLGVVVYTLSLWHCLNPQRHTALCMHRPPLQSQEGKQGVWCESASKRPVGNETKRADPTEPMLLAPLLPTQLPTTCQHPTTPTVCLCTNQRRPRQWPRAVCGYLISDLNSFTRVKI